MDSLSVIGVASQLPIAIEIQVLTPTCGELCLRKSVFLTGQVTDSYMHPAEEIRPFYISDLATPSLPLSHILKSREIPMRLLILLSIP